MPTMREQTTKKARAYTREVSPPSTTWWVPPHPSLARRKGRAHRSFRRPLRPPPAATPAHLGGGKPTDDPEQRIAEVQVLLGLRTQPGPYLRNHEDIGIPEI